MSKKRIAFRLDSSEKIGTGHFTRCLTLADYFKKFEVDILFLCKFLLKHHQKELNDRNIQFEILRSKKNNYSIDELAHSEWLGTSQLFDANITKNILKDKHFDLLIIDHYALDYRWESVVQDYVKKIFVIDDLADREHLCDVLLDQNFYIDMNDRYRNLLKKKCLLLLGPQYSLLKSDFLEMRAKLPKYSKEINKILVFFGGFDKYNFTSLALSVLQNINYKLDVDVVIGKDNPHTKEIKNICKKSKYSLHIQTSEMAKLMLRSDLSIGASGSTSWERCSLGLPSLVISVAENQKAIAEGLSNLNVAEYVGHADEVTFSSLKDKLTKLLNNPTKIYNLSKNSLKVVDGNGCKRVCNKLGFKI